MDQKPCMAGPAAEMSTFAFPKFPCRPVPAIWYARRLLGLAVST